MSDANVSSVNGLTTSVQLLAASPTRKEAVIQNDSSATLYVKFGATASPADYSARLNTNDMLTTEYRGRIDGVWTVATGNARVTERKS